MKTNQAGIDLIKKWEGFKEDAYLCPAGKWTIGFGDTQNVKKGDKITLAEAEKRLARRLVEFEGYVNQLIKVPINENQFSALVSFCYNVGADIDVDNVAEGLGDSTLLKRLNARDYSSAAQEFLKWDKATVHGVRQRLPGLTARRKEEKELFERKV